VAGNNNKKLQQPSKKNSRPSQPAPGTNVLTWKNDHGIDHSVSVPIPDSAERSLASRFPTPATV